MERIAAVTRTKGCVAFWDFVKREQGGAQRFVSHIHPYALDAGNYVKDYWGEGREASYADFPLLGRGPFGEAVQIRKEDDPNFRPINTTRPPKASHARSCRSKAPPSYRSLATPACA